MEKLKWIRIDQKQENNEMTEYTEFLLIEIIKEWVHVDIRKDLVKGSGGENEKCPEI